MKRGAKPGERRSRGRPKGSRNKLTINALETLQKLGCNPLEGMARIAMGIDEKGNPIDVSLELKARMFAELAPYIAPRLRQSELTGPDGGAIIMSWLPPPAA
jgi:hypothetical protein